MYNRVSKVLLIFVIIAIATSSSASSAGNKSVLMPANYKIKVQNETQYSYEYRPSVGPTQNLPPEFDNSYTGAQTYQYYGPDGKYYNIWYTYGRRDWFQHFPATGTTKPKQQ